MQLRNLLSESKWKVGASVKYKELETGKWKKSKIISQLGKGTWELDDGIVAYENDSDFKVESVIRVDSLNEDKVNDSYFKFLQFYQKLSKKLSDDESLELNERLKNYFNKII